MVWAVYATLPLVFAPEYEASATALWLIVLLVFCIQLGALWGEESIRAGEQVQNKGRIDTVRIRRVILLFAAVAIFGVVYFAATTLAYNNLSFSPLGILTMAGILSVARYSGIQEPWLVRILITWMYTAGLLGGMVYAFSKTKGQRLLSFAAFLPALLLGVITSTRAPTLITTNCWVSAFLATKLYLSRGSYRLFTARRGLALAGLALASIGLFFVLDAVRVYKPKSDFEVKANWGRVRSSGLGYLAVFSEWVKPGNPESPGYGAYTLAGPYGLAGLHPRLTGIYQQPLTVGGEETNIYTAFRGLIQDFSLIGAIVVCLCFGIFSGRAYRNTVSGGKPQLVGLAAFYSLLLWSPIISLSIYNGILLAWGMGWYLTRSLRHGAPEPRLA